MTSRLATPPTADPPVTSTRDRPSMARRVPAVLALVAVFAFYGWTAFTNARTFPTQMDFEGRDYFNLLTDAFVHGQVSLLVEPAPELLALEDPYDPTKNYLANRVHDLSLYEGKYYLYWGPTPVLTLFAPARVLLRGDLPERAAIVIYAFVGLVFSLLLLRWLVNRYVPGSPPWMLWFGGVALATGNVMPFLLRRPTVYEVAISAGFCFAMASVYFVLTGALRDTPSIRRLAVASACLGLALGARLTMGVVGLVHVAVLVQLLRRRRTGTSVDPGRLAAALIGPVALSAALLLLYNHVRFGSFTEFGVRYQLNDVKPYPQGLHHVSRGLYYYLVAPPRFDLNFSFFHLPPPPAYPGPTPLGYNQEPAGGLLAVTPITLLAVAVPVAFRRGERRAPELGVVLLGLVALGGAMLSTLAVVVNGVTMRYSADFTTWFLVAGLVMWTLLTCRSGRRVARRAIAVAGAFLIVAGAVVGVAISFTGTTDGLRAGNPGLFESLERAAGVVPAALTMAGNRPVIADVSSPTGVSIPVNYRTITRSGASFGLGPVPAVVRIVSPDDRDAVLRLVVSPESATLRSGYLIVTGSASGPTTHSFPGRQATVDLPVRLERGVNRVELRTQGLDAQDGASLVQITDLRVLDLVRAGAAGR